MRRLVFTITLACVLSVMARAGEIPTTGVIATPTPSPTTAYGEIPRTGVTTGEIHSTSATAPQESSTLITIILTIISIVP